jgi:hypothetical protein
MGSCRNVRRREIVREKHLDQPGIRGTPNIILSPQRMQPSASTADLPGHQGRGSQTTPLSMPCTCWEMPMRQKMSDAGDLA